MLHNLFYDSYIIFFSLAFVFLQITMGRTGGREAVGEMRGGVGGLWMISFFLSSVFSLLYFP